MKYLEDTQYSGNIDRWRCWRVAEDSNIASMRQGEELCVKRCKVFAGNNNSVTGTDLIAFVEGGTEIWAANSIIFAAVGTTVKDSGGNLIFLAPGATLVRGKPYENNIKASEIVRLDDYPVFCADGESDITWAYKQTQVADYSDDSYAEYFRNYVKCYSERPTKTPEEWAEEYRQRKIAPQFSDFGDILIALAEGRCNYNEIQKVRIPHVEPDCGGFRWRWVPVDGIRTELFSLEEIRLMTAAVECKSAHDLKRGTFEIKGSHIFAVNGDNEMYEVEKAPSHGEMYRYEDGEMVYRREDNGREIAIKTAYALPPLLGCWVSLQYQRTPRG